MEIQVTVIKVVHSQEDFDSERFLQPILEASRVMDIPTVTCQATTAEDVLKQAGVTGPGLLMSSNTGTIVSGDAWGGDVDGEFFVAISFKEY